MKKTVLTAIVRAAMIHVAYGLRVPKASDATGKRPNGMIQLRTRIHVSARIASASSSSPFDVSSGRPDGTWMPHWVQILPLRGRCSSQLGQTGPSIGTFTCGIAGRGRSCVPIGLRLIVRSGDGIGLDDGGSESARS